MTKEKILLFAGGIILLALVIWTIWGNLTLELTEYTIQSPEIPAAFAGFRIVQISDLHNDEFGENNQILLTLIQKAQPDIIAITGDFIDSRRTDVSVSLAFAEKAVEIAPCYYVAGNHESRLTEYEELKTGLLALGVVVLEDAQVEIQRADEAITLLGVLDPAFGADYWHVFEPDAMEASLSLLSPESDFSILLSHRPELMDIYARHSIDLVLSGHAHGGQFRLPFLGGVYGPSQGFFPEYDAGLFEKDGTRMIISRGIGQSLFPFRFNNHPEVVLITLNPQ